MIFLHPEESRSWRQLATRITETGKPPFALNKLVRPGLIPAFHYFIGTRFLAMNKSERGRQWITAGLAGEEGGLFSNAYLSSFLERHNDKLVIPETIFADPGPYIHFAGTPCLVSSRKNFRKHCTETLPSYSKPIRIMDIGCGHGIMLMELLQELKASGNIEGVEEVLLIDPSEAMLKLAVENISRAFPEAGIRTSHARIEAVTEEIEGHYDLALSSIAYHHMPYEIKLENLRKLKEHIDRFILFEVEANHDTPDINSPELALSVYQVYGGIMDFVFEHDAPVELAISSIDRFLMSEVIYFFLEPRGKRSDYHMLRSQWHQLFTEGLGEDFSCSCDSICYGDKNVVFFTMIYGKAG